jgi:purine nucleosidase
MQTRAVILDHDGGLDDLLVVLMLLAMPHVDLRGIVVTPADCFLGTAVTSTLKILRWAGRPEIEVARGRLHGVNAFPTEWRAVPYAVEALPILNDSDAPLGAAVDEPGDVFLARKLREATSPVTVLVTGPVSNLAAVLEAEPALAAHIAEVVWMGGALEVIGNVRTHEHDGSAEWNAFWDPPAVERLWRTDVPLTLVPLDATNLVPVSMDFLQRLARQRRYPLSDLAGQIWAMTVGRIPAYDYIYFMWDTLTAGYLGAPELLTLREVRTAVEVDAPAAGRIHPVAAGGKRIRAATSVDVAAFHDYLLALLRAPLG